MILHDKFSELGKLFKIVIYSVSNFCRSCDIFVLNELKGLRISNLLLCVDCLTSYVFAEWIRGNPTALATTASFQRIMDRHRRKPGILQVILKTIVTVICKIYRGGIF